MAWFWDTILVPILEIAYVPLDWVLGWCTLFPSVVAVTGVAVISGLAITFVQKYGTDQRLLGQCKADLRELKRRAREAKRAGDAATAQRVTALIGRIGGRYAWRALKPSLWTVPVVTIICLWTGARLGFRPVRPGEAVEVKAHFEDRASGYAHILPGGGLEPAGAPVAKVDGMQAVWKVRGTKAGTHPLTIRHGEDTYEVALPVSERGSRAPEPVKVFRASSPTQDRLQAVEFVLAPSMPEAWWNLKFQWAGLYIWVAVVVALGLRFALGVH